MSPTVVSYMIHSTDSPIPRIEETEYYAAWFASLRDRTTRMRIDIRIRRLAYGNAGDVKPVGAGISELRLDHGPGYRVYFVRRAPMWIVLLAGGDKSTQERDIRIAKRNADGL